MARRVLKYVGAGKYDVGHPAADLSNEDVHERAVERGMTDEAWVAEALTLVSYYELDRQGKAEYPDVQPAATAPKAAPTAEPKRKG